MDIQILHNGYDEVYDICQIHLFKLNAQSKYIGAFSINKNEQDEFEKQLVFIGRFSSLDERLKLFFDMEYQNVSFMSQYFLQEKGKVHFRSLEEFEQAVRDDSAFKEKVIAFYLEEQFASDQEVKHALMNGYHGMDSSYKVMLHDFLNFYDDYIGLLFQSMYKIQKELEKEYQRSTLLLKRLQSSFDISLLTDNEVRIHKWVNSLASIEVSFSLCNRYLVMRGDAGTGQGWITLGVDYVTLIEQEWRSQISMVEVCKALGDDMRMRIIYEIQQYGEKSASAIAKRFGQSVKAVFYHLEILRKAQILSSRIRGRNTYFSMNESVCKKFVKEIQFLGGNDDE